MVFRKQDLSAKHVHGYCGVLASELSWWIILGSVHACVQVYLYLSLFICLCVLKTVALHWHPPWIQSWNFGLQSTTSGLTLAIHHHPLSMFTMTFSDIDSHCIYFCICSTSECIENSLRIAYSYFSGRTKTTNHTSIFSYTVLSLAENIIKELFSEVAWVSSPQLLKGYYSFEQ